MTHSIVRSFTLSLLLLLFFPFLTNAQHTIRGRVLDQQQLPYPDAAVVLLNISDSTIVKAELADAKGMFSFEVAGLSSCFLKITATGFEDQFRTITDTNAATLSFEFILKEKASELKTVTVSARKPLVERRVDRMVFNVENSILATGGDALDALKRSPGVRVNNGDVAIVGKSTVRVMINGRLIQMSGEELAGLLRSIPSDNISRIEVITTPPAKYDAEGNAGLVNIVTKKPLATGLQGSLIAGTSTRTGTAPNASALINFRQGKFNTYLNGNFNRSLCRPTSEVRTYFGDQYSVVNNDQICYDGFERVQLGADYSINTKSVLGFSYTLGHGGARIGGEDRILAAYRQKADDHLDSFTNTVARLREQGLRNVFNVNYEYRFDSSGKKITADVDHFTRLGERRRELETQSYLGDGNISGGPEADRNTGKQFVDIRSAKLDVELPTKLAQFTFGAKASVIHNTSENIFEYKQGGNYENDVARSNEFDYKEQTQALYGSMQKSVGDFEFQLGLRGEYTQTTAYSATAAQTNNNRYFQLFPTAYVQYKLSDDHVLNANYSRRIQRPSFWQMNPFRVYTTPLIYEDGNPFLLPAFANNIELGYTLKEDYIFTVYANYVDRIVAQLSVVDTATGGLHFTNGNVGKSRSLGFTFMTSQQLKSWWELDFMFCGYHDKFSSDYASMQSSYSRASFNIEMLNSFYLNKAHTLSAEVGFDYQHKEQSYYQLRQTNYNIALGAKAMFFKKKLILTVEVDDVFKTEVDRSVNLSNGTVENAYYDVRELGLSLTWKFGGNSWKKREHNTGMDEENRAR